MTKNFKRIFILLILSSAFMTACHNDGQGLSSDLVNNPRSASRSSGKEPQITFDTTAHDFGKLLQGEKVSYTYHFTNTGNMPLLISRVNTTCGCTVGEFSKEPVKPGDNGTIKVTYDSNGHEGYVGRSLTVVSNTNPSETKLYIKAMVKKPSDF